MVLAKNIWQFWIDTWYESKTLFWAEAIATAVSVYASILMGFYAPSPPMLEVFIYYTIGSVLLQYAMYVRESSWMFVLMSWYTMMNFIGLWNILGG